MIHESKENSKSLSSLLKRREFFKSITFLSLITFSTTPLHAKGSKEQFKYQDTPKNGKACKDCMHFEAETNTCKIVKGSIDANGWCTLYKEPPK
ncbi:high-potential iron-sulfur protein [Arcobacter sp. F2176]|uniref:high-potential iron-sulfur protein n=1 Tax=Arcobacter sp. F2176 TaxID=2044511 RepID=UPI00100BCA9D|nr:high-potential iron-sulfur protein [Arcobacter sp. F2176]RXJ80773.1 iron oxidase oxidoreductase [Arcobacter sp. F2176]